MSTFETASCALLGRIFENARNLLAGYSSEKSAETSGRFYISVLFYPILASLNKNTLGKKLEFALSRDKKLHIPGHSGSVKVGFNQKKIQWKKLLTKRMLFALRKGWFIYAKQNKTFKLEYCEKTSSAICAIFDNRCC